MPVISSSSQPLISHHRLQEHEPSISLSKPPASANGVPSYTSSLVIIDARTGASQMTLPHFPHGTAPPIASMASGVLSLSSAATMGGTGLAASSMEGSSPPPLTFMSSRPGKTITASSVSSSSSVKHVGQHSYGSFSNTTTTNPSAYSHHNHIHQYINQHPHQQPHSHHLHSIHTHSRSNNNHTSPTLDGLDKAQRDTQHRFAYLSQHHLHQQQRSQLLQLNQHDSISIQAQPFNIKGDSSTSTATTTSAAAKSVCSALSRSLSTMVNLVLPFPTPSAGQDSRNLSKQWIDPTADEVVCDRFLAEMYHQTSVSGSLADLTTPHTSVLLHLMPI
ncbi:hypothetical protein BSLG_009020 [Batrachochytrium salamandrivorans]|nr:hypothetical protein BSLG_009020 [Batrachochytrium salamandrivorans]